MSTSYVHEFAKIGSVDDVYSIYDIALYNNDADLEKIANDELAALRREAEAAYARSRSPSATANSSINRPTGPYRGPQSYGQEAGVRPPPRPSANASGGGGHAPPKPAAKPAAAAAAAAAAAEEDPGTLRRAYRAIMANKGKSALGLAAGGAGAYALHRGYRHGNRD